MRATMEWLRELETKRLIALAVAPGVLTLGADAAISHLAGREGLVVPAQYTPILFAPLACLALLAVTVPKVAPGLFARVMRAVGAVGVLVGLIGTGFHVRALLRLLEGAPITRAAIEAALAVAPPLVAPGAFAAIGAALFLLASPRVQVRVDPLGAVLV